MSDTPRTSMFQWSEGADKYDVEFARQLERELNEADREVSIAYGERDKLMQENYELMHELSAANKERDDAKDKAALANMSLACIDDIVNGDDREGMTDDSVLVKQVGKLKRDLEEAQECLREIIQMFGMKPEVYNYGRPQSIERWMKAAKLTKENT